MTQALRVACLLFPPGDSRNDEVRSARISEIAEVCLRWTTQIAVSGEAIFLEIGKCRGLYGEDSLRRRLQVVARKFACPFRLAFADDVPSALALARLAAGEKGAAGIRAEKLPIEALVDYADPFGLGADLRKPALGMVASLRKLGVTTLGAFLALSAKSLPSRFGKLGILLHQRIREAAGLPWPRFVPKERILERSALEASEVFHDLEPLFFFLKPLIDRAMARLRGRGERVSSVRVALTLEKSSFRKAPEREWRIELALPQGSSVGLIPVLRERLGFDLQRQPLAAPVTGFELEVLESAPGRGSQRDFFHAREEEIEAWNSLVARLSERLGAGRVFQAAPVERYLPEKAWTRTLTVTDLNSADEELRQVSVLPERPLRLLKYPSPLRRQQERLVPLASRMSRQWRIQGMEGPEILSGEWWFRQFERTYFRVKTDTGEHLWIFKTAGSETLYLHGYFD